MLGRVALALALVLPQAVLSRVPLYTPTECDACLTVTEEFFQRWAEAHEEHNVVELNATKASDREPWWTTAGVNVHPPGTSFERRLESTCDPARLSLYKPLVQRVCADMLLSSNPGSPSGGRRLVHKLSNADPAERVAGPREGEKLQPSGPLQKRHLSVVKLDACTKMNSYCTDSDFDHMTVLTDRCGLCFGLANDLLYLIRRGFEQESGEETGFYRHMIADMCLSIDLRHPRGQHDKLQALCNRIISKHEEKLVDILVRFGKDEAATRHQFQEAFCGEEGAGICKS